MLNLKINYTELMEVLKAYYLKYYSDERAEIAIDNLYYLEQCAIAEDLSLLESCDLEEIADIIAYEPENLMTEEEAADYLNQ